MLLKSITSLDENNQPLVQSELPRPIVADREVLIKVSVCGVCHTELDEIEGRTPPPFLPVVPGHQVVGHVTETGGEVVDLAIGDRVGVAWIYSTCGVCWYCQNEKENLCPYFEATGRDKNGGYAQFMKVSERFTYKIPDALSDAEAAPLLCAGAIGYRSLRLARCRDGMKLGFTGFGSSAHLMAKMVLAEYPATRLYVFARNPKERDFALKLGASWAGDTLEQAPEKMDSIIDTTPAWKPVVAALAQLKPGGRLVINAIRKENVDQDYLLKLNYARDLWMEKEIKSVANVQRRDVKECLELAAKLSLRPVYQEYSLTSANRALHELKKGTIIGAKVLRVDH